MSVIRRGVFMRSLVVKEDISSERRAYGRDREMVSPGQFSETGKVGEKETGEGWWWWRRQQQQNNNKKG